MHDYTKYLYIGVKITANAMRHMTETRHDDGQQTVNRQQTVMRWEYAETTVRGLGHVHAIVSTDLT